MSTGRKPPQSSDSHSSESKRKPKESQALLRPFTESEQSQLPEVLYEDNHLLAVNKRSGDISQGDRTGDEPLPDLLKRWIKWRDKKPGQVYLGVAHRLDRPTTGVILFAKTSKALERLNRMLQERKLQKFYWAVSAVRPDPPSGHLKHYLRKDQARNRSKAFPKPVAHTKAASLDYQLIASGDRYHLIEIKPGTGRHHQIRAQLSAVGCPIKGDLKYGAPRSNPDGSIHLHARALYFEHPVRHEPLRIVADPPSGDPLWQALLEMAPEEPAGS